MVRPKTHLVIPDCQVKPGVPIDHMDWIGNYIRAKRPDVIVCLGDFADLPSLSKYDTGTSSAEGRRYVKDVKVARKAMDRLTAPWRSIKGYKPAMHFLNGNHEDRADREWKQNPKLEGLISSSDMGYEGFGWKVHPFLKVVTIDKIQYSHFFTSGVMGKPVASPAAMVAKRHSSAVMGHVQEQQQHTHPQTQHVGLFAGICYRHNEAYLGRQGNNTKRGVWMLHEVKNGTFDPMFVSLDFLKRRYS